MLSRGIEDELAPLHRGSIHLQGPGFQVTVAIGSGTMTLPLGPIIRTKALAQVGPALLSFYLPTACTHPQSPVPTDPASFGGGI